MIEKYAGFHVIREEDLAELTPEQDEELRQALQQEAEKFFHVITEAAQRIKRAFAEAYRDKGIRRAGHLVMHAKKVRVRRKNLRRMSRAVAEVVKS